MRSVLEDVRPLLRLRGPMGRGAERGRAFYRVAAKLRQSWLISPCAERHPSRAAALLDCCGARALMNKRVLVFTIIDIFSRFSPALEPRLTFRGTDVVEVLERVCNEVGFSATIRVDQGSEFVSRGVDLWAYQRGVTLDFSRPGKTTDNAYIEAFNGRFRAECFNAHWFLSLADAQEKVETCRRYYNEERPHGAIGNRRPILLHNHVGATSPPT